MLNISVRFVILVATVAAGSLVGSSAVAATAPTATTALTATASTASATVAGAASTDTADVPAPDLRDDIIRVPGVDVSTGTRRAEKRALAATIVHKVYFSVVNVTSTSSDNNVVGLPTSSTVANTISAMNSYWSEESGGTVKIELGGFVERNQAKSSCDPNSVLAAEESGAFGGMFDNYDWVGTRNHLIVLTREACGSVGFGTLGGDGGEIFSGNGSGATIGLPILLHEFGHNLGFEHADSSICNNSTSYDAAISAYKISSTASCVVEEYADFLDIMGYSVDNTSPHLSSPQRILSGYLSDYTDIAESDGATTTTVTSLDGTGSVRALRVTDPVSGAAYYIEYRTATGEDANSAEFTWANPCSAATSAGYVKCQFDSSSSTGAVRILRELPFPSDNASGTTVLAVGLTTGSSDKKKRHTHLEVGDTFTNYTGGFAVKVNSMSPGSGASLTVSFRKSTETTLNLTAVKQTYGGTTPVTATATVAQVDGSYPAGTFAFFSGGSQVASVAAASGTAQYTLSKTLAAGKHTISARFTPSATSFAASASTGTTVTVAKAKSTTTIKLKATSVKKKNNPYVYVTVTVPGITKPTGKVVAYAGGKKVKSYTLSSTRKGKLTIKLPKFSSTGTKTIKVRYTGSASIGADTSSTLKLKIKK